MVSAIWLGLSPYWLGSPVIVGLAHAADYLMQQRQASVEPGR
jgi:hypothetical protein